MSSSNPQSIFRQIVPLSGHKNYMEWCRKVRAHARMAGFYEAYLGNNTTTSTDASELDKIAQREQKALGLITGTVTVTIQTELKALKVGTPA